MDFQAFQNDIEQNRWQVFGAEVYQHGLLLHAFGDTAENRHPIFSATKTITSIAAGMAWDAGKLDLDCSVLRYLPERFVSAMPPRQQEAYRYISLHRLMTMSVPGYPFRPEGDSWLTFSLHCSIDPQAKSFAYSNIPAYLVGVATACALDVQLEDYLNDRLFMPLGIAPPPITRCPDGYFYGASGMELTVHDLSQIGLLLMNGGEYGGQHLLSGDYVRRATSVQQMNREGGYGYFLWKYRDGFSINGKWGQKCFILPQEELMVIYLSHMEENGAAVRESMERHILGI